jgi:hypothetical protein
VATFSMRWYSRCPIPLAEGSNIYMTWYFAPIRLKNAAQDAAAKLAKYAVQKNIKKSPQEAFKASWESLLSNPLYRFLVRISQDPTRDETRLKGRTFKLLSREIPEFFRSIRIVVSADLKAALDSEKPIVIVQIHEGHDFLSRVMEGHNREFTRIVGKPKRYAQRMRLLGIDTSRAHLIGKGVLSLAHLRKSVRSNHVICCIVDYGDGTGRRDYISPAIFVFANRTQIPVFFVKARVDDALARKFSMTLASEPLEQKISAIASANFG